MGSGVHGVEVQVKQVSHATVVVFRTVLLLFLVGSEVEVELLVLDFAAGVLLGIVTEVEVVQSVPADVGLGLLCAKTVSEVKVLTSFVFLRLLFLPPLLDPKFFFFLGGELGELDGLPDFLVLIDSAHFTLSLAPLVGSVFL